MNAADSRLYPGSSGLLPCPFCGGEAYQVQVGNEATRDRGFDVGCRECRVKISDRVVNKSLDWLKPKNIANWNKRPLSAAQGSQEGTPSAAGVWFSSLIESLRPFAYYFDVNDCEGRSDGDALEIPVSDLRAARDLLKKLGIDTSLPPWAPSLRSTDREYDPNVAPCDDAEFGMKP